MEAAIRSHQVGTGQQSAQQPQSDLRGSATAAGPQQQHPSMSQYSQPRSNASSGINEVHRSSATSSPYQISHGMPHAYVDQRNRVRPTNTFSGASANSNKTNYNWQPNAQFEYAPRTTLHQSTNYVNASFAAAQAHGGFAPRVSVSIPQQPSSQQQSQSVQSAPRQLTEYITASIRDNTSAGAASLLQASQTNQQRPQPDPGGTQQSTQQTQPSIQPAYKKIRLGEPSIYQPPQTNSLHHPATAPTSIPVRLHHAPSYDKTGQQIQSNNPVVVQVASTPRLHQNPIVGATAEIQYQPQKPPQSNPAHQIPTAASPQAQQSQSQQQQTQPSQQSHAPQPSSTAPQSSQAANNAGNANTKVLSVLKIDTRDPLITGNLGNIGSSNNNSNSVGGGGYHPKTEAISPAGSPKLSKDDLLQQISSVDSSMMSLEERKRSLKEKERTLLEQKDEGMSIEVPEAPTTHRTLAQQIYAENKKKANDSHAILTALNFKGQTFELPLYNQPSDADVCRKIHEQYLTFRSSLLLHLRKIKSERAQRNQELADKYAKLSTEWQKRVEKIESSIKRKNREFKNRELFEKVFVELRKQREDKERFNRVGSRVKSEADFEVIVDGLQEQAQEDKKMRSYAVIPPIMFDSRQRRLVFQNENGSQVDMEAELSAYKTLNLWTTGEKEIFRDKYVQQAKNFGFIASNLERKNAQDCVRYYYLSKKDVKYKQLLRKSSKRTRSTKNLPKTSESQSLLDLMTTGVTTRLQRKARITTNRSSNNSSSAAASANESQTTNSISAARSASTTSVTSAPLPTVTVTVSSGNMKSEEPDNENDPLGMTETSTPSPASNTITNKAVNSNNNGNVVDSSSSSSTVTTTTTTNASFLPANIKTEPDGDVVMKTESDSNSNNWSTYPPNGLKHEIKTEEIKMEGKAVNDESNAIKKEETKDEKKIDIKKEPNDDKENEEGKGKKSAPMDVDDENSYSSEPSSAKKRRIDDSGANDLDKTLYPCFVCKQENCSRTKPLEKAKAQQYGLNEENIPVGVRVCNNCQSKAAKSRFSNTNCPLPTCPNPKDRVKRFRNLPARLFELAPEERDPIIKELQIPPNVTKCCSACLTRIKRKMGAHLLGTTSLSEEEIQQFRNKLQDIGPKWSQLAEQLNKSATVLKTFYYNYKKKYGFDQAVNEYYKMHANEDRRAITDGDESDVSVTSSDDNGSDTNKNEFGSNNDCEKMETGAVLIVKSEPSLVISSTPSSIATMSSSKDIVTKIEPQPPTSTASSQVQVIDDRLPPPLGQPPPLLSSQHIQNLSTSGMSRSGLESHPLIVRTKKHSEEYDSSATETADEENESSPANRQSPKAVFGGKGLNPATTISMVVGPLPPQQNGPIANVRDVLHNVIERVLKNPGVPPLKHNPAPVDTNPDVAFVSAYRQDPNKIQIQPQRRSNSEGGLQTLATLSIVNSHGQQQTIPGQNQFNPLNISSIAATITPVPPPPQSNQQLPARSTPQHMISQDKDMKYHSVARAIQPPVQHNEPEPQTLDLSIKKPQPERNLPERNFPAFQAKAPPPPTAGSIYRGDPNIDRTAANIPNQSNYLAFHPDRPSKSPSNYIPPPLSPGQRVMGIPPPHSMQQPQQIVTNKSKVTPKLSPKVHHQMSQQQQQSSNQVQQINGPKGSITHGTPINDRGQPITIQNERYNILRHTPPSGENKFGSIIAGTPVNINDKRVHEYMKNNRHSPATNQQNPTSSAPTGSPHPTITYRQPSDLSSSTRDLVFSDYMISQQMHNQQARGGGNMPNTISIISGPSGRSEKESPSPRSIAHSSSPASLYYADKDRDRVASGQTRTEYLSRSSPADHHNSTPSPHRTPPPQRQGVIIQRHNNASSKPPSPAPLRQGHFAHHYSQGHDALSNLVDVAVAQQALPVPNDNSRRPQHMPPTSSSENLSSLMPPRDRYPYLIPAEVMALQQQQQIDMIRRQQQQQHEYNERKEREIMQERDRDRERDRERDERENQRRVDAELAHRNYERERDRMEQQLRISYQPRLPYNARLPDEISAQCLINAIITENISRPSDTRERYHHMNRLQAAENNGNSHSPNVINVDVDSSSDLSRHSISSLPSKNLKLNDITDAIIAKDPAYMHHQQNPPQGYHLPSHLMRTSYSGANSIPSKTPPTQSMAQQQQQSQQAPQPMGQEQIIATDQWKLNRRLQQQEMAKSGVNMQGRSTPDDRHVIRMAQSPSPRTKMAYEPVSPPETSSHYHNQPKITINAYDQRNMPISQQENAAGGDENKLLKMINHRLAEVMRNDEKYPNEHHADGKDRREGVLYERPRSGNSAMPGNGINSGDKSPAKRESPQVYGNLSRPSSQPGNIPFQQGGSLNFMYPFSALTIPQAAGANPIISPKAANEIIDANRQQQPPAPHHETRQVLSENYDALSDED